MNEAILSSSPTATLRRVAARLWDDPDARSTAVGLVAVILMHLLLFGLGPTLMRYIPVQPTVVHPQSSAQQFEIEISPESFPEKAPPQQFVETNPDAPENIPDRTNNFGAQNQQVAQEKPTPDGTSERPALDGKKDFESTQIVSGRLTTQEERIAAAMAEMPPVPPNATAPIAEQNPLSGFEKTEGDSPDGIGTNVAPSAANARPIPERIEGMKDVPLVEGAMGLQPAIDPKRPRPRPQIVKQQQVRPAILAENKFGTANVGVTAINAKFSNYGAYLQRLVEAVQLSWDGLVQEGKAYPPSGSYVVVKFVLNSQGNIARVVDVDNHSSDVGSRWCVSAIANRAPYGEWTEDMKAVLGEEQELMFTFYYQ